MNPLAKKFGTVRRVLRQYGTSGVLEIVRGKFAPYFYPPRDYARTLPPVASLIARHGRPDIYVTANGAGIGDDLLCTAVFHELRRRGVQKFWTTSKYRELYEHNEDAPLCVPVLPRCDTLLRRLGTAVVFPFYTSYNPAFDRDEPLPQQHLISIMCQKVGITGEVTLRPYLVLTDAEREKGRVAPRPERQIAIQSAGLDANHAMMNKNWYAERYQGVVDALKDRYDFVQVGSRKDPTLEGALDLRGTTSLRGAAAVLSQSVAFVGQVGMLMHLARAVDCRSVIVYGGRELPSQSGYSCNENLYSPVACSPCWRLNSCAYDRMCLRGIGVDDVVQAVDRQAARYGTLLEVDTATITEELIMQTTARYEEAVRAHRYAWTVLVP